MEQTEKKVIYRKETVWRLNKGWDFARDCSQLHYGVMPDEHTFMNITDYDELFSYVKECEANHTKYKAVSILKRFFGKKEYLAYSDRWTSYELKRKDFRSYTYESKYVEVPASYAELMHELPAEEFAEWIFDHKIYMGIKIPGQKAQAGQK